jgi:peroxiredoxin
MAVQLIIFALQNNGLKSRLDYFTTDQEVLQSGEEIKPFFAYDLRANRSYISFANDESKGTLILLFSTKCEPCKINLPNWKYIISSANKGSLKILVLANDSVNAVQKFANVQNLNFPVYSFLDQDIKINLKGFITPQTILLSRGGRVIKTWAGILNQIRLKDVIENINSVDNQ